MEFLILSLLVSHNPSVQIISGRHFLDEDLLEHLNGIVLQPELRFALRALLTWSLMRFLKELEELLARRDRAYWTAMCFGICLVLLGAESFQVDIHLKTPGTSRPRNMCVSMEVKAVNRIVELFHASTAGISPLRLD